MKRKVEESSVIDKIDLTNILEDTTDNLSSPSERENDSPNIVDRSNTTQDKACRFNIPYLREILHKNNSTTRRSFDNNPTSGVIGATGSSLLTTVASTSSYSPSNPLTAATNGPPARKFAVSPTNTSLERYKTITPIKEPNPQLSSPNFRSEEDSLNTSDRSQCNCFRNIQIQTSTLKDMGKTMTEISNTVSKINDNLINLLHVTNKNNELSSKTRESIETLSYTIKQFIDIALIIPTENLISKTN